MVERLDRTQQPPGYVVEHDGPDGRWYWDDTSGMPRCAGYKDSRDNAIAAAWAHFEAANDPPGMVVYDDPFSGGDVWWWGDEDRAYSDEPCDSDDQARAAVWAWYWRRVAVADKVEFGDPDGDPDDFPRAQDDGVGPIWPRCLAWPDEQVAEVERWLAEGGELPEVLRAT